MAKKIIIILIVLALIGGLIVFFTTRNSNQNPDLKTYLNSIYDNWEDENPIEIDYYGSPAEEGFTRYSTKDDIKSFIESIDESANYSISKIDDNTVVVTREF